MRSRSGIFIDIDRVAVLTYLLLVIFGWLSIYASVYDENHQSIFDFSQSYGKQFIWIITSFILIGIILVLDTKFYTSFSYLIYFLTILSLITVLILGRDIAGSRSWIEMGSFRFQPSEFAKLATCLALAKYLSTLNINIKELRTKAIAISIIAVPALLTVLQGDAGSALVYGALVLVLYRFGLSGNILIIGLYLAFLFILSLMISKFLIIGILSGFAVLFVYIIRHNKKYFKRNVIIALVSVVLSSCVVYGVDFVFNNALKEHQQVRINVLLGIEDDPLGAGYNVNQSKIAIGSGGFWGKGFLQGTQTKYDFVPEQSTDFIFCTIGEEQGFFGSVIVIGLFVFLLMRIIYLAERQRSKFTVIYGYGVASIMFFHLVINIGMTIGIAPVIGIPFPFFSYGGSSLWTFTILLFILIKLDSFRLQEFR
ncbi:MAG: rod shape-determining protein RodA [Bacteroidia bacterium]|nr:rod shape-determining protein RodA [Bacteroidia bacterium]